MKTIHLLIILALSMLIGCGGLQFKKENELYIDEEHNVQFKDVGNGWERQDPGKARKHGTIHFFFNKEQYGRIWLRVTRYENQPPLPLKEGADDYVARKGNQYNWNDFTVVSEDWGEVGGVKAFWKVYEYQLGSKTKKEKIYRVDHNKISYLLRFRCAQKRFDALVPDFDQWIKTIEFLDRG